MDDGRLRKGGRLSRRPTKYFRLASPLVVWCATWRQATASFGLSQCAWPGTRWQHNQFTCKQLNAIRISGHKSGTLSCQAMRLPDWRFQLAGIRRIHSNGRTSLTRVKQPTTCLNRESERLPMRSILSSQPAGVGPLRPLDGHSRSRPQSNNKRGICESSANLDCRVLRRGAGRRSGR
jgi:hypothetical protein